MKAKIDKIEVDVDLKLKGSKIFIILNDKEYTIHSYLEWTLVYLAASIVHKGVDYEVSYHIQELFCEIYLNAFELFKKLGNLRN